MPIHDVGYRAWQGPMTAASTRWWQIGEVGVRLAARSAWVRRMVMFAWLPILYWGVGFFAVEQMLARVDRSDTGAMIDRAARARLGVDDDAMTPLADEVIQETVNEVQLRTIRRQLEFLPNSEVLVESLRTGDKSEFRRTTWAWLLMTFFRYPQSLLVVFLIGFIAPGLISRDIRSRALLLYFSRPIGKREYLLGKLMIPAVFLMLITTLPALTLYVFGLFLSPDLNVVLDTWDVPLRIAAASLVLVLPVCSLALMLSSFTEESRFASFAWFAVWVLGLAAWTAILIARAAYMSGQPVMTEELDLMADPVVKGWAGVSLYLGLGQVQSWIFGFDDLSQVWPSLVVIVVVTVLSLILLYRNISSRVNA
jgi:ABC-type transport system involved in multi-copper enzyme maturation permease subunit